MEKAAKIAIFILVLLGFGLWVFDMHPHIVDAGMPSVSLVALEPGVLASETSTLPGFQETGVLIYDLASGLPGTPYLVYVNQKGELMTRQMIFSPGDACSATAGDLPCTDSGDENPAIPAGTALIVTGGAESQGVFVDSYKEAPMPGDMVVFTAALNQPVTLSNGSSITLQGIANDASCTLGEGCFGDGVTRAAVQLSSHDSTKTVEMVPGSLHEFSSTTFVALSIDGTGSAVRVRMLAVRTK